MLWEVFQDFTGLPEELEFIEAIGVTMFFYILVLYILKLTYGFVSRLF